MPKPKVVIQAGLYRTGTTWQFNAIRVLLEMEYGEKSVFSCWEDDYVETRCEYCLVKTHRRNKELASIANAIVTTSRPLEDVIVSMQKRAAYLREHPDTKFQKESNINRLEEYLRNAAWWRKRAKYIQDFNRIENDPLGLLNDYIDLFHLEAVTAEDALVELNKQLIVPEEGHDPRTFLHAGHITRNLKI